MHNTYLLCLAVLMLALMYNLVKHVLIKSKKKKWKLKGGIWMDIIIIFQNFLSFLWQSNTPVNLKCLFKNNTFFWFLIILNRKLSSQIINRHKSIFNIHLLKEVFDKTCIVFSELYFVFTLHSTHLLFHFFQHLLYQ